MHKFIWKLAVQGCCGGYKVTRDPGAFSAFLFYAAYCVASMFKVVSWMSGMRTLEGTDVTYKTDKTY